MKSLCFVYAYVKLAVRNFLVTKVYICVKALKVNLNCHLATSAALQYYQYITLLTEIILFMLQGIIFPTVENVDC